MRKVLFSILFTFIVISLFVSCNDENDSIIGKTGPAGGIIFYDCDADNDSGNYDDLISSECGWRYLEAAPLDLDEPYSYNQAIVKCEDYYTVVNGTVYDDWYLPNEYELNLMYVNLAKEGKGSFKDFEYYWSSDKSKSDPDNKAYAIKFKIDYEAATRSNLLQSEKCYVRPARAYLAP